MSLFGHLLTSVMCACSLWRPPGGQNCDIHLRLYYMQGWDCNGTTKPQASSIGIDPAGLAVAGPIILAVHFGYVALHGCGHQNH